MPSPFQIIMHYRAHPRIRNRKPREEEPLFTPGWEPLKNSLDPFNKYSGMVCPWCGRATILQNMRVPHKAVDYLICANGRTGYSCFHFYYKELRMTTCAEYDAWALQVRIARQTCKLCFICTREIWINIASYLRKEKPRGWIPYPETADPPVAPNRCYDQIAGRSYPGPDPDPVFANLQLWRAPTSPGQSSSTSSSCDVCSLASTSPRPAATSGHSHMSAGTGTGTGGSLWRIPMLTREFWL